MYIDWILSCIISPIVHQRQTSRSTDPLDLFSGGHGSNAVYKERQSRAKDQHCIRSIGPNFYVSATVIHCSGNAELVSKPGGLEFV